MAGSSDGSNSSALQTILIAVVIALLTGGSAPFWWQYVFPSHNTASTTNPPPGTGTSSSSSSSGGQTFVPHPTGKPTMAAIERRTNLSGGDFGANGLESSSSQACSNLCLQNDSCKAMTFVYHPTGGGGVCWLKNVVPAPSSDPSMDSAIKLYP